MLQLLDLFLFRQHEIDLNMLHDRCSILTPTCQVSSQVKRLCHEHSVTVIWMTHINDGQRRRPVDGGGKKTRLLQCLPRLYDDSFNPVIA